MNRRSFLSTSALTGSGLLILPSGVLAASPNNKLNIALIGVWIFLSRQMQGGAGKAMGFGNSGNSSSS